MGATNFLRIHVVATRTSQSAEVVPILGVQREDVGDRPVVDLSVYPHQNSMGYVANDVGDVYRCGVPEGRRTMSVLFMALIGSSLIPHIQ